MTCFVAWWIAFGPHGPRAGSPPGEWTKIWLYTAIGVGASAALFFFIHSFARPPPRSMTKEWQEATNEYLRVSLLKSQITCSRILTNSRASVSTLFTVSVVRATTARVSCKVNLPNHKVSRSNQMKTRRIDQFTYYLLHLSYWILSMGCTVRTARATYHLALQT